MWQAVDILRELQLALLWHAAPELLPKLSEKVFCSHLARVEELPLLEGDDPVCVPTFKSFCIVIPEHNNSEHMFDMQVKNSHSLVYVLSAYQQR